MFDEEEIDDDDDDDGDDDTYVQKWIKERVRGP